MSGESNALLKFHNLAFLLIAEQLPVKDAMAMAIAFKHWDRLFNGKTVPYKAYSNKLWNHWAMAKWDLKSPIQTQGLVRCEYLRRALQQQLGMHPLLWFVTKVKLYNLDPTRPLENCNFVGPLLVEDKVLAELEKLKRHGYDLNEVFSLDRDDIALWDPNENACMVTSSSPLPLLVSNFLRWSETNTLCPHDINTIKLWIKAGADPNHHIMGRSLFYYMPGELAFLLEHGFDPTMRDDTHRNALGHWINISRRGKTASETAKLDLTAIRHLLLDSCVSHGVSLDGHTDANVTHLHTAIYMPAEDILCWVTNLLQRGANPYVKRKYSGTAIEDAVTRHHEYTCGHSMVTTMQQAIDTEATSLKQAIDAMKAFKTIRLEYLQTQHKSYDLDTCLLLLNKLLVSKTDSLNYQPDTDTYSDTPESAQAAHWLKQHCLQLTVEFENYSVEQLLAVQALLDGNANDVEPEDTASAVAVCGR